MITGSTRRRPVGHGLGIAPLAVLVLVLVLVLAGCGSAPRADVADMYVSVASESGFEVDPACVERVLGAMSDDDVTKLSEAGLDGNADLSEQGYRVLLTDIPNQCIDVAEYIANLVRDLESDPAVNADCVRAGLADATSPDDVDRALDSLLQRCGAADV